MKLERACSPPSLDLRPAPALSGLLALSLSLLLATPALAGTLTTSALAAFSGAFGLLVTVTESCIEEDDVTLTSPPILNGDFGACSTLNVSGVEVGAAGAEFRSPQVTLGPGFSVPSGNELEVLAIEPRVRYAFVVDDSPAGVATYRAVFRIHLDLLSLAGGDSLVNLAALDDHSSPFEVIVVRNETIPENRIVLRAETDGGGSFVSSEMPLAAGWNLIDVRWAAGAGTGSVVVSINGSTFSGIAGLDNDRMRVDSVRWGAAGGVLDASTGSFFLDDFASFQ